MEDFEIALAQARTEAPELLSDLKRYRFEDQYHLIRAHRRFVTWGLCELFCQESLRLTSVDPRHAVEAAELAVLISDLLSEDERPRCCRLYQLRGYAWAHDGNARRVLGDVRNADESFSIAESWWEAGEAVVGDALGYEPVLLELKSSLRLAQRRFPEAFQSLDRLVSIHSLDSDCSSQHRDCHRAGRALILKALGLAEVGEPDQAIALLHEAETLVDVARDPRLYLCLRHNLLWNLTITEEFDQAASLFPAVAALCLEVGNPLDQFRLRWAEGRVAVGLGKTDEALQIFQDLRQGFAARGIAYDAALVTLELTALYARQGDLAEVKGLSLEMARIFQLQDVPREALAALLFFQKAAERERATAKLAREIASFLEKLRSDPAARFELRR